MHFAQSDFAQTQPVRLLMRKNSGWMFAGAAWEYVIAKSLFFGFNNGVKGQIPELCYLNKESCVSGTGPPIEVSSNNGLLLDRPRYWSSQMNLQQLGFEEEAGGLFLHLSAFPCLTLFSWCVFVCNTRLYCFLLCLALCECVDDKV